MLGLLLVLGRCCRAGRGSVVAADLVDGVVVGDGGEGVSARRGRHRSVERGGHRVGLTPSMSSGVLRAEAEEVKSSSTRNRNTESGGGHRAWFQRVGRIT